MARTVRRLDDTLVDQIAAGEVIERPANLVKELLENALDAGAAEITVSVEDGGRAHVQVRDDGVGMSREDATLAIERHATSKIATFDDLSRLRTLGFRGEALPSIGSVSRMTITTRPRDDVEGTQVVVEGGAVLGVAPAGGPPGTTVVVDDLFFNVPARKKFLKARQTETSRIFEVCQNVALSHPTLRLVVHSDGRVARRYLPCKDLHERACQVFRDADLRSIEVRRGELAIDASLAPPERARPGTRHLSLLINGRPVTNRQLSRAIAFAFGDALPPGHYPRGVVSLRMPPEDVDVNAHPQKTEVRFRRSAELLDQVTRMLAAHLPARSSGDAYWDARLRGGLSTESAVSPDRSATPTSAVAENTRAYASSADDRLHLVAQRRGALLVCESRDALVVLDRGRADMLRRLDALRSSASSNPLPAENLLFPDRVQLSPEHDATLDAHDATCRSLGFDWSSLGERTCVVRSIPALATGTPPTGLLMALLDHLQAHPASTRDAALGVIARASALPNGREVPDDVARDIARAIDPDRAEHASCVVARAPFGDSTREPDA